MARIRPEHVRQAQRHTRTPVELFAPDTTHADRMTEALREAEEEADPDPAEDDHV